MRWISGYTLKDRIINACISRKLEVALIDDKMNENHLRQFGHMNQRPISAQIRKMTGL